MKITIEFPKFHAAYNQEAVHQFLKEIGGATKDKMVIEASGPKSGRIYTLKGGRTYQASAPGEYPANKYGILSASYQVEQSGNEVTVGTNVEYAKYLRGGTTKMAKRKFLKEALHDALEHHHLTKPFVEWRRG